MATALNNTATINGQYNGEVFDPISAASVAAIVYATVTNNADPAIWIGDGALTHTVEITNNDTEHPLTNLVVTDILDPALTVFVSGSTEIDGTAALAGDVTYDELTGLLTVQVPDIPVSSSSTITFRVMKKQ